MLIPTAAILLHIFFPLQITISLLPSLLNLHLDLDEKITSTTTRSLTILHKANNTTISIWLENFIHIMLNAIYVNVIH